MATTNGERVKAMRHGLDAACDMLAHHHDRAVASDARFKELTQLVQRAWKAYQCSGVMSESDGRTKNVMLDVVGVLLDEAACLADGVH